MRWWIVTALLLVVAGTAALGEEATQTGSWKVDLTGRKTWTIRYGLGNALALAAASVGAGQLTLDQTMAVDFTATALSMFRVKGHFNDQEPDDMQSLSLYFDTDNIHGVLGDFTAPNLGSFFSGSRTMKGARVDVGWDGGSAVGIASQLSGVRDSRLFVGSTASGEVKFAGRRGQGGVSYAASLDGLGYFELRDLYVEDFTEARLRIAPGTELDAVLQEYGVSELGPAIAGFEGHVLDTHEALVVGTETQFFLLKIEPRNLVREAVREAIRVYDQNADTAVSYPFVVGSDVELEFLSRVSALAVLAVGAEKHQLADLRGERFYDLGQEGVTPGSISAFVSLDGRRFIATNDPELVGYSITVHEAQGILEVAFPKSFFGDADAALKASFSYAVTGGAYMLGMSIIPGSERVTLNGQILTKDKDYSVDYEIGVLILSVEIGPSDPLLVEFERYSAGGGSGAYARGFFGATASLPVGDDVSLTAYALRAADERASVTHPESVKTMPNTQTVVGLSGSVHRLDLTADFNVGYTNDLFPYDDNARTPVPNRVNALGASSGILFAGTDAGFSALEGGVWRAYDASSGLSGREVRAIAVDADRVFFGTNGGLTVVSLTGVAPLDKVANWSRYGATDGLTNVSVRALLLDGENLWVGTDGGLFRVGTSELKDSTAWKVYEDARLVNIRSLCLASGVLFVGTTEGLVRVDPTTGAATAIDTSGHAVLSLASDGETLYAAGEEGVQTYVGGAPTGWIVHGEAAYAVAVAQGDVFFGGTAGLARVSDGDVLHSGWTVTALGLDGDALWVGTRGSADGELLLWREAAAETAYDSATTKIVARNSHVFSDSAASEHTATGWTAEGSFFHQSDGYSIAGTVDRVLPGFRAIDARGRSNAGGWTLTSDIDLGPNMTLSLDDSYQMTDVGSADAATTADNRLVFHGSLGPEITLSVDYKAEDTSPTEAGFERNGLTYDLSVTHHLFDDAVHLSIGWDEGMHWDDGRALRRETSLSTSMSLAVAHDLNTSFSWQRPIHIVEDTTSGSERWQWKTDGSLDVAGFGAAATYELDGSRTLPDGALAYVHKGTLAITMNAIDVGAWAIVPRLDFDGNHEAGATTVSGRLTLPVNTEGLATRALASVDVSGLGSRVVRTTERLTSSVNYTAIEGLRPSLNYSGSRTVTQVEGQGRKESWTQSLNGRLSWSGDSGVSEELRLAGRLQDTGSGSVTVNNTFSRDVTSALAGWIPALQAVQSAGASVFLRTEVSGEWRHQTEQDDVAWHATAAADVALSSTWTLSLGLGYYGGVKTDVDMFHGLVAELTAAIGFRLETSSPTPAPGAAPDAGASTPAAGGR